MATIRKIKNSKKGSYQIIVSNGYDAEGKQIRVTTTFTPDAVIVEEIYTGTKFQGRKELEKLLSVVQEQDTIVFDSVSRMSRDADSGYQLYQELYTRKINLVFLKEPHINTSVYRDAMQRQIEMTGNQIADIYINATNEVLMLLAKEQIKIAFMQSEKEVQDLHQRTREGIETARKNGKQIGQKRGRKLVTKKSIEMKKQIRKLSRDFGGTLCDVDVLNRIGLSRNTYYKYKRELKEELEQSIQ